jgi:protein-disulfide isomerase
LELLAVQHPTFRHACAPALLAAMLLFWPGATRAQIAPQSTPVQSAPAGSLSPAQVEDVERIIRDYLLRNPELILEAVENLEQKRRDEAQRTAKSAITERRSEIFNDPDSPVAGNPQGDVTVVEFFDYRCPYCKQVEPSLAQLRKEDSKLRVVYKELPILGPDSVIAARAALAARKQGKYLALHEALMRARGSLDEATVLKIAGEAGLDSQRLKADMGAAEVEQILDRNLKLARALAITGTPGFVVGDTVVPGAVDLPTLKSLVADARKK